MRGPVHGTVRATPWPAVVAYAVVACAVTWLGVAPLALAGLGWSAAAPPSSLHLLGALGPVCGALLVTWWTLGRDGLADLWRRVVDPRRIRGVWWLLVLSPLALAVVAALAVAPFGGLAAVTRADLLAPLAAALAYGAFEEIGWRGFLLPRLQAHMTAVRAAGWVFAVWALWHLPMFAYQLPGGLLAVGWLVGLYFGSVWLAVLHNGTGGSVLACILWHATYNVAATSGEALSPLIPAVVTTMVVAGTIVAVRRVGPTDLCRGTRPTITAPGAS